MNFCSILIIDLPPKQRLDFTAFKTYVLVHANLSRTVFFCRTCITYSFSPADSVNNI